MNKRIRAVFFPIVFTGYLFFLISIPVFALDCSHLKACEHKFCKLEKQLEIAQEKGNKGKVNGLTKALENAKEHCTDKDLKEDLIEEIEDVNAEIVEYESDLKEAKEYGKKDKIHKYQEKIEEEKNKIKHLESELSDLD